MLVPAAAVLAALIFFGLAVFQGLLAAGRPMGRYAWGGRHESLPANLRLGSAAAVVIFLVAIVIVLGRAGLIPPIQDTALERYGIWVLVALFSLSTIGNLVSRSQKEKRVMTPVAVLLVALCLVVAISA
jgi:hypothetical protein